MSRYIDADALKKSIDDCDICNICPDKDVRCDYDCDFPDCLTPKWETLIDSAPSIDIEPKQGEWIVYEGGWKDLDYYPPKCKCNQCGYEEELYILNAKPTNFCSNCGAKMKGADDDC